MSPKPPRAINHTASQSNGTAGSTMSPRDAKLPMTGQLSSANVGISGVSIPGDESVNATRRLLLAATPSTAPDALAFNVTFGTQVQMQLTYLTSYAGMGAAKVELFEVDAWVGWHESPSKTPVRPLATFTVDAATKGRFSVPRTSIFVLSNNWGLWRHYTDAHTLPSSVRQGRSYMLCITSAVANSTAAQPTKFKLISVTTC